MNYGAGIWGTKGFSCINSVQHRACRLFSWSWEVYPKCSSRGGDGMVFTTANGHGQQLPFYGVDCQIWKIY